MKRKAHRAALSKFQIGLLINSLYNERKNQIAENEPIEQIDSLLLRLIDIYDAFAA